ncbi:hypothetical protein MNBD_NITROSPINAE02-1890 [hydrothermal vent metagenome]|uniref:FlgN protein n=1 Tax=hydrothermal vent metagenome TaxID=652676 RepID=A0A3B1D1T6_9ZZZZ
MRNDDLSLLLELMKGQKSLYEELLRLAMALDDLLDSSKGPDELAPVISERDDLLVKIKKGDGEVSQFLSRPGREKLLESDEPTALVEELKRLIKNVIKVDAACEVKLGDAQDAVQSEFSKVMKTRKDMGLYGFNKKPVFAKFIDLKH